MKLPFQNHSLIVLSFEINFCSIVSENPLPLELKDSLDPQFSWNFSKYTKNVSFKRQGVKGTTFDCLFGVYLSPMR